MTPFGKSALALLGLGIGLGLLSSHVESPVPPPPPPPPPPPLKPPPLTLTPKGRMLTPFEMFVLRGYFPDGRTLLTAKLWFSRPRSSFTGEHDVEEGVRTDALTTKNGIYFPFENHEFRTADELGLLAHELVHWKQFIEGTATGGAESEMPAYEMQVAVVRDLTKHLADIEAKYTGERYA